MAGCDIFGCDVFGNDGAGYDGCDGGVYGMVNLASLSAGRCSLSPLNPPGPLTAATARI